MNANISVQRRGAQRAQVFRDGICIKDTGKHNNLITDLFFEDMTRITGNYGSYNACYVTTNTEALSNSDNVIDSSQIIGSADAPSASTNFLVETEDGNYLMAEYTRIFTFDIGSVEGNISTIATQFIETETAYGVHTHALITDANGDPTTITVTAEDQLIITHWLESYYLNSDITGTVLDDDGVTSYNWTARLINATNDYVRNRFAYPVYFQALWLANDPYSFYAAISGAATEPYFGEDLTFAGVVTVNATVTPTDTGNIYTNTVQMDITTDYGNDDEGLIGLMIGDSYSSNRLYATHIMLFDPVIPKTSDFILSWTMTFTHSRYEE